MRRNLHVMFKNFRGIVLTKTLLGYEGRLNPIQIKRALGKKNEGDISLVIGWSTYEPDEKVELTPTQALNLHECLEELKELDIRFNVDGHTIENGAVRLSYSVYNQNAVVTRVWLNGIETKELIDIIQEWIDISRDYYGSIDG